MTVAVDALIVGAGPAGSAAAILLARAGWSVALVEKERFPRRKVCGECVAPSNLPLLDSLGVGAGFEDAAGPPLRRVAFMHAGRVAESDMPAPTDGRGRWGRALGRETLDAMLLEQARAAGAEVLQPWSAQAIDGGPGDWHCRIRSMDSDRESVVRARAAIDAHGSWEALPSERRASRRTPRASDLLAFKANFRDAALAEGTLPVLGFRGGYGGMVVADGGTTTVACCIRRDRLEACRAASPGLRAGEAVEALLVRECRGVREALQGAARIGRWLAAGPLQPGVRVDAGAGPLRIGNAAGEAHPIIGEGMSMALQSAWLLCSELIAAGRPDGSKTGAASQRRAAQRYVAQWRRQFEPRLLFAAAFARLAMHPAPSAALVGLSRTWPGMLTVGARIKTPLKPARPPAART
jgi:flavin-dependent dehydrogenase